MACRNDGLSLFWLTFLKIALKYLGNEVFNAKIDRVKYHKCKGGYHADRKEDQSDFQPSPQTVQDNPGNNWDQRCTGEYFKLYFSGILEQICLSEGYWTGIRTSSFYGNRSTEIAGEKWTDGKYEGVKRHCEDGNTKRDQQSSQVRKCTGGSDCTVHVYLGKKEEKIKEWIIERKIRCWVWCLIFSCL